MATPTEKYVLNDDEVYASGPSTITFIAQTFTIGTVGPNLDFTITSLSIKGVRTVNEKTLTFGIYETDPAGAPLVSGETAISTGTIDSDDFLTDTDGNWKNITMSEGTLKRDIVYALVISSSDAVVGFYPRADGSSPSYTGGSVWESSDSGVLWTADTTTDLMFQINGADGEGTLCTISEAINNAGGSATGNSVSPLLVLPWINQAEAYINVQTEVNWVDKYSTMGDDVKKILNRTCAAAAAIKSITYNLVSDDNRVASETMVNIYREELAEGIQILRDKAKKNFIETEKVEEA